MRRFRLIGRTLKHSFSQNYFSKKFADQGIVDCSYENFELQSIEQLPQLLKTPGLNGLNITIPYKEQVIPFLHEQNQIVQKTGACNCIKIKNEKFYGYNTDAPAFQQSLQTKLKPHHKSALILGSGGASKAIQYALDELKIQHITVSRNQKPHQITYEDVGEDVINRYDIVINTTPLGMYPDVEGYPDIPYKYFSSRHLLFDLTYNPEKTKFLQLGEEKGAQVINGYQMLVLQAEESWRIWNS